MGNTHIQAGIECGFNLVGIADSRASVLNETRENYNLKLNEVATNYEDILSRDNFDLAIVATTAPSHHQIVLALTKSRVKYILCEKPISNSLSSAKEMVEACRKNKILLAVNHQMRFMEIFQFIKQHEKSKKFGSLRSMVINGANIGLAMNGTHYFEAFRYLTNSHITKVWAWLDNDLKPNPRGPEFFDQSGQIFATNENGQRLFLEIGSDLGHQIITTYNFEFGKITVNVLNGIAYLNSRLHSEVAETTARYDCKDAQEIFHIAPASNLEPSKFVLNSLVVNSNFPTGLDGIHTISVALAAIESNNNGNQVVNVSSLNGNTSTQKWA